MEIPTSSVDCFVLIFSIYLLFNQPTLDDGLPGKICSQCVFKCISWDSFKQLCERTESMLRTQLNIRPTTPPEIPVEDSKPIDADIENRPTACRTNHAAEGIDTASADEESPDEKDQSEESGDAAAGLEDILAAELDADFEVDVLEMIEEEADCDKSVDEDLLKADEQSNYEHDPDANEDEIEIQLLLMVSSLYKCSYRRNYNIANSLSFQKEHGDESILDNEPIAVAQSAQDKPALDCPTCQKQFPNRRSLSRHMQIHVVGLPFKCDRCDRSYKLKSSLSLHSRCHRDDVEPFVCDLCGKSFLRAHGLQSHQLTHSTELPFACDLCAKRFKNEVMLRNHRLRHDSVKRFMCDECGMGFVTAAELRTHSRKHTGLKPFQCDECPKSYKTKTHLTVHMRSHTGHRPFECEFCEQKFAHKKVTVLDTLLNI